LGFMRLSERRGIGVGRDNLPIRFAADPRYLPSEKFETS
jgi:hypothetical protein